jgi:predicted negative regulator of RcsB-dependent stress response
MAAHLDLEEQEQLEQVKAFWKRWGNLITWVITLALASYAAWQGWNWYERDQANQAAAMYDEFERAAQAGDVDKASSISNDLRSRFAKTGFTAQAGLQAAKLQFEKGKADAAQQNLEWVAEHGNLPEYRDLARLRLAGVLMDAKKLDEAAKALDGVTAAEFAALVADRRGDLALLQNKPDAAREQFQKALAGLEKTQDYRRLVEAKLATLGVAVPEEAASAAK